MRVDVMRGAQLIPSARGELARFRHRVFVQKLGWEMKSSSQFGMSKDGEESDEYDRDDTIYVTLRHEDAIVGCARLLPATHRYLLGDHFPHLVDDLPAAIHMGDGFDMGEGAYAHGASHTPVWELSRFAWEPPHAEGFESDCAPGQQSMQGARELLRAAVFTASSLGARRLIGVTFVSLARLFVRIGVPTHKLGAAYRIDGRLVAAYRIDIDATTCTALGLSWRSMTN
ncbi:MULTISPECIES: acyl-homoserine-lactone synthase [Pandoraea]|uniref:acyl-homoserine-lactone synthase n=1 Tax=Pandoraea TaxID=93217 RepID=UPI001F5D94FF|nr:MULTISPECIES: acyl-homoserine-lactone synthase [Pandoraea]MCI3205534.1 acyl-homoserine-lactone synthase [Pandoraea sp. LA3]MDN4583562.1 acyl-homoserine-lactone synthase [Pandoraea capi]